MTLRLVNDNLRPDDTLYCRHGVSCQAPATVLVTFCDQPPLPSCDHHARLTWERHPSLTQISPLAEYVDMFAAAKEAALITPEQVIEPVPAAAPAPVPVTASAQAASGSAQGWGIGAGISFVLGVVFCLIGAPDGTQIESQPNGLMIALGVLLILASIVAGITCAVQYTRINAVRIRAQRAAAPAQQQYAGGSYQQGIPVEQLAMAAMPWIALGLAEHHRHVRHEQALQAVQDNKAAWQAHAAARDQQQWQQDVLGELRAANDPGPAWASDRITRRSDIYGNLV